MSSYTTPPIHDIWYFWYMICVEHVQYSSNSAHVIHGCVRDTIVLHIMFYIWNAGVVLLVLFTLICYCFLLLWHSNAFFNMTLYWSIYIDTLLILFAVTLLIHFTITHDTLLDLFTGVLLPSFIAEYIAWLIPVKRAFWWNVHVTPDITGFTIAICAYGQC